MGLIVHGSPLQLQGLPRHVDRCSALSRHVDAGWNSESIVKGIGRIDWRVQMEANVQWKAAYPQVPIKAALVLEQQPYHTLFMSLRVPLVSEFAA
jgi:hypothetical protein